MQYDIENYKRRPRTVAFYGRVSTEHEQQLSALSNQMDWYIKLAQNNPNWHVVARYIDEGITGTQMKKRPSFMQMLEHAKQGRFDLIVTRELSRFARNTVDALNATRELKQYGVEVYFVNDGIWTMDGDGEVRLTIMASIAQDESRKTSERVKAGQKISREKGVLYGNGNILGYDRIGKSYVINEEQAATVRRIYELYAAGTGEQGVADTLMAEGRKDGGGGCTWTASKVSRVLRKPTYKGYITYNRSHTENFLDHKRVNHAEKDYTLVKGDFEPIVSEELWNTCNELRTKRAACLMDSSGRKHAYGKSFPQNKWTKILYCDCGAPMRCEEIDKKANGILNMRFICSATKRIGRKTEKRYGVPCPNPYASEWKLELMAREVFRTVWKDRRTEVLKTVRAVNTYLGVNKTDTEAEQLMSQREVWNRAYDALELERVEKRLDFAEFVTKSNEIAAHIAEIDKALTESSHTAEPVNRFDVEKIEAVLSEKIAYPEGKIDPDALKNYVARVIKSNNRYVWLLSLAERLQPEQTQKMAMMQMVTYNGNAIGNEEKPASGKTEIPDREFLRRGQNGFILNATRYRRARLTERLFASETALPNEPIPLVQFEIDYPMAYQYQKEQGSATHPGRWQNLEVEVYLI